MLMYNPDITPPKYWSSANYNSNYYLGENYDNEPYIVDVEGYETIDELIGKMDALKLSSTLSKSKLIYDEDDDFDESSFDLSDIDEARELAQMEQAKMSKPTEPLAQPSNNSPQGVGASPQIAGATTTSGESTGDVSQV